MGSSIPSNWQSGVYKYDKRNPHFLFPSRMARDAPWETTGVPTSLETYSTDEPCQMHIPQDGKPEQRSPEKGAQALTGISCPSQPTDQVGWAVSQWCYSARLLACSSPFLLLLSVLCDLIAQAIPASAQASR